MSEAFFQTPILNSPLEEPDQHWDLVDKGQPTSVMASRRRQSALVSPIPRATKVLGKAVQPDFLADKWGQGYNPAEVINGIRSAVDVWTIATEFVAKVEAWLNEITEGVTA